MKEQIEKQAIEEMQKDLIEIFDEEYEKRRLITPQNTAEKMTAKGYRKQSEGEWIVTYKNGFWYYDCPFCDDGYAQEAKLPSSNYCSNCGAKLSEPKTKGGAK